MIANFELQHSVATVTSTTARQIDLALCYWDYGHVTSRLELSYNIDCHVLNEKDIFQQ